MGVYVMGMKTPSCCMFCPVSNNYGCGLANPPIIMTSKEMLSDRPEWCPLVPVPPHGRLIDADALAEDLDFDVENDQRALDQMDFVGKGREHIQFDKDCKQNCMWYLSEAPTIIPAEEGET